MNAGKVIFEVGAETKSFEKQINQAEKELANLEKAYKDEKAMKPFKGQEEDLKKLEIEIEKAKNKLIGLRTQEQKAKGETKDMSEAFSEIGEGIGNIAKKVAKWSIALFGIRSIYMGIRSVIGTVSQYNSDIADKIESIKYTLTMSLMPVIEKIINFVYTLVQYIQYIIKQTTGYDIFASASKNLANANKSAKELKKSMAGFDTANTLSDTSTGATSAGAMVGLNQGEVPSWVQWIVDNKDLLVGALLAIAAGIVAINVALAPIPVLVGIVVGLLAYLVYEVVKSWEQIKITLLEGLTWLYNYIIKPIFTFFTTLIKSIVDGVVESVKNIIDRFSTIKDGFKKIFDGILLIFKGDFKNGLISIAKGIANILIGIVNGVIDGVNAIISPIRALIVAGGRVLGQEWTMDNIKIPRIPKLATGGIVSLPGRGVPVGGAISGEAGREGVLPLTDSQTMAQLGQEIGKWISVNIDLTNKIDSRVLSRTMQKINNSNTFARNGG